VQSLGRSIIELAMTVGPLVLLWALMWATLHISYWLCLLLAVPTAGFLVRLFMIQHDCGHGGRGASRGRRAGRGASHFRPVGASTDKPAIDLTAPVRGRETDLRLRSDDECAVAFSQAIVWAVLKDKAISIA
jgi:hypothetical protein